MTSKSGKTSTGKTFRASTISGRINGRDVQKADRIFQEIIPIAEQQKGFVHALHQHSPQTGEVITTLLWETQQALDQAASNLDLDTQLKHLMQTMSGDARLQTYDVTRS